MRNNFQKELQDKVLIIAEIGSNHNGSLETAYELIDAAADSGADVCKLQSFLVDDLLESGDPNYETLKKLEMPRIWYPKLIKYCEAKQVKFLSTATNYKTLGWMEQENVWGYKLASCNITHLPLIEKIISYKKPVIISTGMANLQEILETEKLFTSNGHNEYAFLHCISKYPVPHKEMNLKNINILEGVLNCAVGISDHTLGTHISIASVALGARIVEKHISIDKKGIGMDHDVAILPEEFKKMCKEIRDIESCLSINFFPDKEILYSMRRSMHYNRDMEKGTILQNKDIKIVRPEDGILPYKLNQIIGKKIGKNIKKNNPVLIDDFK